MVTRCLVVEDDRIQRKLLCRQIQKRFRCSVVQAENGVEGLRLIRESLDRGHAIEHVLTDIDMPEMDGLKMTKSARSIGYKGCVVAASASESYRNQSLVASGVDFFIKKPLGHALKSIFSGSIPEEYSASNVDRKGNQWYIVHGEEKNRSHRESYFASLVPNWMHLFAMSRMVQGCRAPSSTCERVGIVRNLGKAPSKHP
mmetsp:Transcript_34641/g.67032  ORF Transcript_34641/g.67032 Transcript_34641/m.67032 type:complete len:200 (+) Transcript_34641:23-622(+)